jgi:hypothetical protein
VIAEWDGWELRGEPDFIHPYKIWIKQMQTGTKMIPYISPSGKEYDGWHNYMKYLTSLDWLHPVAMDVMDKLTELFNTTMHGDVFMPALDLIYNIKRACYIRPINGEYIDLFNAVYEGIVYLNSTK